MAVNFFVDVNGKTVEFAYDQKQRSIAITAIDAQTRSVICQTGYCDDLETAIEQATLLVNNRDNKLFWHPV